jgi:hypothetical protein
VHLHSVLYSPAIKEWVTVERDEASALGIRVMHSHSHFRRVVASREFEDLGARAGAATPKSSVFFVLRCVFGAGCHEDTTCWLNPADMKFSVELSSTMNTKIDCIHALTAGTPFISGAGRSFRALADTKIVDRMVGRPRPAGGLGYSVAHVVKF